MRETIKFENDSIKIFEHSFKIWHERMTNTNPFLNSNESFHILKSYTKCGYDYKGNQNEGYLDFYAFSKFPNSTVTSGLIISLTGLFSIIKNQTSITDNDFALVDDIIRVKIKHYISVNSLTTATGALLTIPDLTDFNHSNLK